MNKKIIILTVISIVVILIAVIFWQINLFSSPDRALFNKIKDNSSWVELFDKAKEIEKLVSVDKAESKDYLTLGFYWKSLGDRANITDFYYKALAVYEQGAEKLGQQNALFYWNAGKLAESVNDYNKAESYYKKIIETAPGDESGYIGLADLYFYKLKKPETEILKVYEQGIINMVVDAPLIAARASYLRLIGDDTKALEDYEALSKMFPDNAGYKEIIRELEQGLN